MVEKLLMSEAWERLMLMMRPLMKLCRSWCICERGVGEGMR